MADGKFLVGKPSGGVTTVTVADGATNTNLVLPESGTVSGVTTAVTDNAIPRFDGTTGKLQNSLVTITDTGLITGDAVTQSYNDFSTAFRLLKLGDFGVGGLGVNNQVTDCDDINIRTGFYGIATTGINKPSAVSGNAGMIDSKVWTSSSGLQASQVFYTMAASPRIFTRNRFASVWSPWIEVHIDSDAGTFTPRVYGATTAGVGTYTTQVGYYEKFGREVRFNLYVVLTAHTGTGAMYIDGLPYLPESTYNSLAIGYMTGLTYSNTQVGAWATSDGIIRIQGYGNGIVPASVSIDTAFGLMISGSYRTA